MSKKKSAVASGEEQETGAAAPTVDILGGEGDAGGGESAGEGATEHDPNRSVETKIETPDPAASLPSAPNGGDTGLSQGTQTSATAEQIKAERLKAGAVARVEEIKGELVKIGDFDGRRRGVLNRRDAFVQRKREIARDLEIEAGEIERDVRRAEDVYSAESDRARVLWKELETLERKLAKAQ